MSEDSAREAMTKNLSRRICFNWAAQERWALVHRLSSALRCPPNFCPDGGKRTWKALKDVLVTEGGWPTCDVRVSFSSSAWSALITTPRCTAEGRGPDVTHALHNALVNYRGLLHEETA